MKNKVAWLCLFMMLACQSVEPEEFNRRFNAMSNLRNDFRKSMKALGDSSFTHRDYARQVVASSHADTALNRFFAPQYGLYNDSLRARMQHDLRFFEAAFDQEKPFIQGWEQLDMRVDRVIEMMKTGDLSEAEGLDSLTAFDHQLRAVIARCDSTERSGSLRYWDFRKTWDEYQYNLRNLKILYGNEIYRK